MQGCTVPPELRKRAAHYALNAGSRPVLAALGGGGLRAAVRPFSVRALSVTAGKRSLIPVKAFCIIFIISLNRGLSTPAFAQNPAYSGNEKS